MGATHHSGPVVETSKRNSQDSARAVTPRSMSYFVHPIISATATGGNLYERNGAATAVNTAAHDWSVERTAAAANHNPWIEMVITPPFQFTDAADATQNEEARGFRLKSIDVIYTVTIAVADAIAPTFDRVSYADGAAASLNTDIPVTLAGFDVAAVATLVLGTATVTTPIILAATEILTMDLQTNFTAQATGVFRLYGVRVNGDLLL